MDLSKIDDDPVAGFEEIKIDTSFITGKVIKSIQRGCIARVKGNDCMHHVKYSDDTFERLGYDEIKALQKKYNFMWSHE